MPVWWCWWWRVADDEVGEFRNYLNGAFRAFLWWGWTADAYGWTTIIPEVFGPLGVAEISGQGRETWVRLCWYWRSLLVCSVAFIVGRSIFEGTQRTGPFGTVASMFQEVLSKLLPELGNRRLGRCLRANQRA